MYVRELRLFASDVTRRKMSKVYKVWIRVEEIDEDTDETRIIELATGPSFCMDDRLKAVRFVEGLHSIAKEIDVMIRE